MNVPLAAPITEPPPPLVSPAMTHAFELDLVVATNKMIERLLDKRPGLSETDRRAFERVAKVRCVEVVKRAAVECSQTINDVVKQSPS